MQKDEIVREQMFAMVASWQASGLTQKLFCEQEGIRYHVFHYWYKCYRDAQSPSKEAGFIPLNVKLPFSPPDSNGHSEIVFPDGRRVLFHQPVSSDYLKAIIS